ncbi:hypothetical protein [Natronococcus wangiae]|uniref:hypothetical protein n=1 Tax=Natronococcus wangiae TaxID=3068275 RepID=UPI00273E7F10|nr:hypothetical protein [Natronococcus sp. AD5]
MIGALTAGKKAVTFGYKRYGIPGAIAAGGLVLVGYVAVRRAMDAAAESDRINEAVDVKLLLSAVEDEGLDAIADPNLLDEAVNPDRLGSALAMDDVRSEGIDEHELDDFVPDDARDNLDPNADG